MTSTSRRRCFFHVGASYENPPPSDGRHAECACSVFDLMWLVDVVALASDLGLDDRVGRGRVGGLRAAALEFGQDVHAFNHAAKAGMQAVEMRCLPEGDKKL